MYKKAEEKGRTVTYNYPIINENILKRSLKKKKYMIYEMKRITIFI